MVYKKRNPHKTLCGLLESRQDSLLKMSIPYTFEKNTMNNLWIAASFIFYFMCIKTSSRELVLHDQSIVLSTWYYSVISAVGAEASVAGVAALSSPW